MNTRLKYEKRIYTKTDKIYLMFTTPFNKDEKKLQQFIDEFIVMSFGQYASEYSTYKKYGIIEINLDKYYREAKRVYDVLDAAHNLVYMTRYSIMSEPGEPKPEFIYALYNTEWYRHIQLYDFKDCKWATFGGYIMSPSMALIRRKVVTSSSSTALSNIIAKLVTSLNLDISITATHMVPLVTNIFEGEERHEGQNISFYPMAITKYTNIKKDEENTITCDIDSTNFTLGYFPTTALPEMSKNNASLTLKVIPTSKTQLVLNTKDNYRSGIRGISSTVYEHVRVTLKSNNTYPEFMYAGDAYEEVVMPYSSFVSSIKDINKNVLRANPNKFIKY